MKYLSIIRYVLVAISFLSVALFFTGTIDVDFQLRWAYILLGIAVLISLLFPVFNIMQNPKGAIRSLAGLAIVGVVVGIAYALSSNATIVTPVNVFDNKAVLKLSDTGLYTTYIALGATILAIVVGEVANLFK